MNNHTTVGVDLAGVGKAAVAFANKNIRTAWALLTQGTQYHKTESALVVLAITTTTSNINRVQ